MVIKPIVPRMQKRLRNFRKISARLRGNFAHNVAKWPGLLLLALEF